MTDTTTRSSTQDVSGVAANAKDEAGNVASSAKDEAASVASTAVDEVKQLGADATGQAKQVLTDARQQLHAKAQEESQRLAGTIADLGQQLRTMANAGEAGLARDLVSEVASRAQQISQHLGQGGFERTVDDAKRLARNRPGTFLLGAAAAGFVAARVARMADTAALKDAAIPAPNGNGQHHGVRDDEPSPALGTTRPAPSPAPGRATAPTAERPLVSDPVTTTAPMPTVEEGP